MDMAHFSSSFSLWLLTFIVIACLGVVVLLVGRPPNPPPSLGSFKQLKIFKTAHDQDAFALPEPKRGRGRPAKAAQTDVEEGIPRRRATDPESGISGARCHEEELFDSGTQAPPVPSINSIRDSFAVATIVGQKNFMLLKKSFNRN